MKRVNACTLGVGMLLRSLDSLQSPTGGWDVGSARLMPRLARNQPSFRAVTSPCRTPPLTICTKIYIKISTPAPAHGRPRARRAFAPGVLHVCALLGAGLVVAAAAPRLVPKGRLHSFEQHPIVRNTRAGAGPYLLDQKFGDVDALVQNSMQNIILFQYNKWESQGSCLARAGRHCRHPFHGKVERCKTTWKLPQQCTHPGAGRMELKK
mmetsp:Transcript_47437/g.151947  ORF Transcript_47437/g.151947 Transcript_47437/m.151947 type:complete len:209 (+) Transcript_47437:176-802(+)